MAGTDIPDRFRNPVGVQPSGAFGVRVSRQDGAEPIEAVTKTPLSCPERNSAAGRCGQINRDKVQVRIMAGRTVLLVGIHVGNAIFVCMASVRMVIMPVISLHICDSHVLRMRPRMLHRHQDT